MGRKPSDKQPIIQANQSSYLQSKRPKSLRDQNCAPGNVTRRGEGKNESIQGVGPNQPDLVRVSSPRTNQYNETLAKLKYANDQISQQLKDARLASEANAKGFDAMAIVVGYLAPD